MSLKNWSTKRGSCSSLRGAGCSVQRHVWVLSLDRSCTQCAAESRQAVTEGKAAVIAVTSFDQQAGAHSRDSVTIVWSDW